MEYAVPGFIGRFCTPNAMLTLAEYLEDYALPHTKEVGYQFINKELSNLPEGDFKNRMGEKLQQIKTGQRDLLY